MPEIVYNTLLVNKNNELSPPWNWLAFPMEQKITYPSKEDLKAVVEKLKSTPSFLEAESIDKLKEKINDASKGRSFILQIGDCAERFVDATKEKTFEKLAFYTFISSLLSYYIKKPCLPIGRIAGQYAKPRTKAYEVRNKTTLPSYMGDMINGFDFNTNARSPDPFRMLKAFECSKGVYSFLKEFFEKKLQTSRMEKYLKRFYRSSDNFPFQKVLKIANDIDCLYTSHDALNLFYEASLTHRVEENQKAYSLSGQLLWLGERTRRINSAHVEYLKNIENPIGIKVSAKAKVDELCQIIESLNPRGEDGKILLITRFGSKNVKSHLKKLIKGVLDHKLNVTWICDPMHGNTIKSLVNPKTRYLSDIKTELCDTKNILESFGVVLGGLHLEASTYDVTECVGGESVQDLDSLSLRYESYCDPRLNISQTVELVEAFYRDAVASPR